MDGGKGNDELHGNGDHDLITEGAGTDLLHGGDANDVLFGGPGADTFYYEIL